MSRADLDQLADRQAILDAVLRYCRGVDRCDVELTKSAYFADAHDDHGLFKGNAHLFAERVDAAHRTRWASTMHVVANHYVEFSAPARANGETYVVAYLRRIDATQVDVVGGRYVDRFERRDGDWRISDRIFVWEWSGVIDARSAAIDGSAFAKGERSVADPSYFA